MQMLVFSSLIILFLLNDSVMSLVSAALKMQQRVDEAKNTGLKKPQLDELVIREKKNNQQTNLIQVPWKPTRYFDFQSQVSQAVGASQISKHTEMKWIL